MGGGTVAVVMSPWHPTGVCVIPRAAEGSWRAPGAPGAAAGCDTSMLSFSHRVELTGFELSPVTFSLPFPQAEGTAGSVATSPTSAGLFGQLRSSPQPSRAPTAPPGSSLGPHGSPGVSTTPSPPTQPRDSADTSGPTVTRSSPAATPAVPAATTAPHTGGDSPEVRMGCLVGLGCPPAPRGALPPPLCALLCSVPSPPSGATVPEMRGTPEPSACSSTGPAPA